MIPGVETLGSKLRAQLLGDAEVLDRREIPSGLPVRPNAAEAERRGTQIAGQLLSVIAIEACFRVEPSIDAALTFRKDDIVRISSE